MKRRSPYQPAHRTLPSYLQACADYGERPLTRQRPSIARDGLLRPALQRRGSRRHSGTDCQRPRHKARLAVAHDLQVARLARGLRGTEGHNPPAVAVADAGRRPDPTSPHGRQSRGRRRPAIRGRGSVFPRTSSRPCGYAGSPQGAARGCGTSAPSGYRDPGFTRLSAASCAAVSWPARTGVPLAELQRPCLKARGGWPPRRLNPAAATRQSAPRGQRLPSRFLLRPPVRNKPRPQKAFAIALAGFPTTGSTAAANVPCRSKPS